VGHRTGALIIHCGRLNRFFNSAGQFNTTVAGADRASSVGVLTAIAFLIAIVAIPLEVFGG